VTKGGEEGGLAELRQAIAAKASRLAQLGGISDAVVKNREWMYMLRADTRNSLSIEGHFASDTDLERVLTGRKSAPEILNYYRTAQSAYDRALQQNRDREPLALARSEIRHIHSELFRGTHEEEARGRFRIAPISISGATVKPPERDIEAYVDAFVALVPAELLGPNKIRGLARLHALFESIHPFADGNGRAGRIILNSLAIRCGFAPIVIKGFEEADRAAYYDALQRADRGFHAGFPSPTAGDLREGLQRGDMTALEALLSSAANGGLDTVLAAAVEAESPLVDLRTMASQEGVAEATLRKRIERNQLVAIRRGKRLVSNPNLYIGQRPAVPEAPTDALDQPIELQAYQPRLHIDMGAPQSVNARFHLSWAVKNVGLGTAFRTRIFLPGLTTDAIETPLESGAAPINRGTMYEDKVAFSELMKPPVQVVIEFEDHAGNVYRQYGKVAQTPVPSGAFYGYSVEDIGRPYKVESRIVR